MNECPDRPTGPMGPWYKKVNELIARANSCKTREEIYSVLGTPDKVESQDEVLTPHDELSELGSTFNWPGGEAEVILTYVDPYRRRKRYRFGVTDGQLSSRWIDTVHADNENVI